MLDLTALNESQRKAVTFGEGDCLVLAGPGSGKTFTMVQRIYYLLQKQEISPEEILAVTFTKDAALSMQRRFQEGADRICPVSFGTFHSFFYHILRESRSLPSQKIATEAQKKQIMRLSLKYAAGAGNLEAVAETGQEVLSNLLSAVSFYKNTGDRQGAEDKLPLEYREDFRGIFKIYEQERQRQGLFDFDDMVYLCAELLRKDERLRLYWQGRFRHILLDEFQDINPVQYQAIRLLKGKRVQIFAVGDDDQSIYGFRGSRPACLKQFAEEFHARILHLNINYRSRQEIVEASGKVIGENKERFPKELVSAEKHPAADVVTLQDFKDRESQYTFLAQSLSAYLGNGESLAVLFRTNSYMQSFAAFLERLDIPYLQKEKSVCIYDHFIAQDIMAYLRLAAGEKNRELLLRIANRPERRISREDLAWTGDGREELDRIFIHMKKMPLYLQVQYVLKAAGYGRYLREQGKGREEKQQEWQAVLELLLLEAKENEDLASWLEAQQRCREKGSRSGASKGDVRDSADSNGKMQKSPQIVLMTAHASKGLEFDRVWIPDCNEKVFPYGKMPDAAACEEERRIFYVAMTRAKKSLGLLYLTGTKERPRLPSRFLNPLLGGQKT